MGAAEFHFLWFCSLSFFRLSLCLALAFLFSIGIFLKCRHILALKFSLASLPLLFLEAPFPRHLLAGLSAPFCFASQSAASCVAASPGAGSSSATLHFVGSVPWCVMFPW